MSKRHSKWFALRVPGPGAGGSARVRPRRRAGAPAARRRPGSGATVAALMKERGLSEADVSAALKTYMPTGKKDDYYLFSSGGQSGQVIVIGIPSMRILKYIAVFTPEPWQGWGYGDQGSEKRARGRRPPRHDDALGGHAPPEPVGDEWRLRRAVPVHRRQGQRADGGDQPFRLHHHADRREPDPRVGPRRGVRHAQYRVRDRRLAVSRPARRRLRADRGVQREVPRRDHALEVRPRERAASCPSSRSRSRRRPTCRTSPMRASSTATAGPS